MAKGFTSRLILISLLLASCTSKAPAPVLNHWPKIHSSQKTYVVKNGDTLQSIAWKFAIPVQKLAQYNGLTTPYSVTPGQTLQLKALKKNLPIASSRPATKSNTFNQTQTVKATMQDIKSTDSPKRVSNATTQTVTSSDTLLTKSVANSIVSHGNWPWPVSGQVLRRFGGDSKGLDIAIAIGTQVQAVASGTVVYAGDHLHGYGQLLIIKHDKDLMTVYAHNSKLMVQEGSHIESGQIIALSGNSEAPQAMLHFEVRQAGHPVDPLHFLKAN